MVASINVTSATTAELVAFFNANTGGNQIKKFADRKTAERRVQALINEMIEDGDIEQTNFIPAPGHERDADDSGDLTTKPADPADDDGDIEQSKSATTAQLVAFFNPHGHLCPHCGIDLCNGVGEHHQEVNGRLIKHDKYQFECLACGGEFGPAIKTAKASVSTGKLRPAMAESMKLDREILDVTTGTVYKNACQVWKSGIISSSQCDRLSATLYGAAKQGNRLMSLTVNEHVFTLAHK